MLCYIIAITQLKRIKESFLAALNIVIRKFPLFSIQKHIQNLLSLRRFVRRHHMSSPSHRRQGHSVQLPQHAGYILVFGHPRPPTMFDSHRIVLSVLVEPKQSTCDGNDGVEIPRKVKYFQTGPD